MKDMVLTFGAYEIGNISRTAAKIMVCDDGLSAMTSERAILSQRVRQSEVCAQMTRMLMKAAGDALQDYGSVELALCNLLVAACISADSMDRLSEDTGGRRLGPGARAVPRDLAGDTEEIENVFRTCKAEMRLNGLEKEAA